jgi:predicted MFS family arabinose efflux permease
VAYRPEGITDLGGDIARAAPDDEGRESQHQVPVQLDAVLPVHVVPPLGDVHVMVARQPGIRAVLAVTVLLLTGHQALYTYVAPFAPGRTSVVLLVFGGATVAGIWITGVVADRYLRPVLLAALGLIAVAMFVLGLAARAPAALLAAAALWGAAFGGAPTLLQTALVDASGPASADVATALQTTVYNVGIAAGSLAGGLVLGGTGAAALPWVTLVFTVAALGIAGAARRSAFPPERREERGIPGRVALLPRA